MFSRCIQKFFWHADVPLTSSRQLKMKTNEIRCDTWWYEKLDSQFIFYAFIHYLFLIP